MAKFGIFSTLAALALALGIATVSSTATAGDDKPAPCKRTAFKTEMVRDACTTKDTGGQAAAKKAMQTFNKEHKIDSCNKCHSKLAPTYELKADGLEQFKKLGGKMIDDKAAPKTPALK